MASTTEVATMQSPREGAVAPNFDLSSTEEAVLMLVDEVPRTALVLLFFGEENDRSRADLGALAAAVPALAELRARPWAVSPLKLDVLRRLQRELGLPFPLLHDDRHFSRAYGVTGSDPALALVGRARTLGPGRMDPARILRLWNPAPPVSSVLGEVQAKLRELPSVASTFYPKSVVDRFVGWRLKR
jgi:peroxiredoxin